MFFTIVGLFALLILTVFSGIVRFVLTIITSVTKFLVGCMEAIAEFLLDAYKNYMIYVIRIVTSCFPLIKA